MTTRFRAKAKQAAAITLLIGALLLALLDMATLPPPLPGPAQVQAGWHPSEAWLLDRRGRLLDSVRVDFQRRRLGWMRLADVAPALPETVTAAEDRRFRDHGGVDWLALGGSLTGWTKGGHVRGASTLTMQLAGFLAPDLARPGGRGWRDKLRQMRAARAIERGWSKDEILEAYLNLAPFRGEAQGVPAAASALFGKPPSALSAHEAAVLAALLPQPGATADQLATRACRLLRDCRGLGDTVARALANERSAALDPGLAPQLAGRLLRRPGLRLATTLDLDVQRVATQALSRQLQGLGSSRARDGAVVVVDNASGDVLAYVGGVGLGSTAREVDGANAYRQAGSTLKPFLYDMVLDKGWLTTASILDDTPVQMETGTGLYVPQNYDRQFKGPVSVRSALAGSLNVPAVRTLLLAGVQPFRDRLWDLGYHGLVEDGSYYGFSLALGSAEVTLLEQANAYRTLANAGRWSPLRVQARDPRVPPRQMLSPAGAWLIGDILSDAAARSGTFGLDSSLRLPFWAAAKTGTSKAMRDNWCIGWSERFTVAVWVGNLEGDSMRAVSGTSGAAPVWRDVMVALHVTTPGRAPSPPPGIEARTVSFAGNVEPPRRDWFLRGTGQMRQDTVPATARRARIVSPMQGTVYALDPDIPINRQRLAITLVGIAPEHRLTVDDRDVGPASTPPPLALGPGRHRLALIEPGGRLLDQVRFIVR